MAVTIPPVPPAPPPNVRRVNPDGTPTRAQTDYDAKLAQFLTALAAAVTGG